MKRLYQGILIKRIPYSENSLITTFYTREEGLQTFLFQGGKKKKGYSLHPMGLFEFVAYQRPESDLGKISSIQSSFTFHTLTFNPIKSGIAFFTAELLEKCLRNSSAEPPLFDFLTAEAQFIDSHHKMGNYLIWLMLKLTTFFGFEPLKIDNDPRYFDIEEGELLHNQPIGHVFIYDASVPAMAQLMVMDKAAALDLPISKSVRIQLQENLITYYGHHVAGFGKLKSWEILQTIFHG